MKKGGRDGRWRMSGGSVRLETWDMYIGTLCTVYMLIYSMSTRFPFAGRSKTAIPHRGLPSQDHLRSTACFSSPVLCSNISCPLRSFQPCPAQRTPFHFRIQSPRPLQLSNLDTLHHPSAGKSDVAEEIARVVSAGGLSRSLIQLLLC